MKRTTKYPLTSKQVCRIRAHIVRHLRAQGGTLRMIAQALRFTPEEVRRYESKARRLYP